MLWIRFAGGLVDESHHIEHVLNERAIGICGCEFALCKAAVCHGNHSTEGREHSDDLLIHQSQIPLVDVLAHMRRYDRSIGPSPGR